MTGGRFTIRTYAAGEIVPPLQVMDAVMQGTVRDGAVQKGLSRFHDILGE